MLIQQDTRHSKVPQSLVTTYTSQFVHVAWMGYTETEYRISKWILKKLVLVMWYGYKLVLDQVQWENFGYSTVESICLKTQCIFFFLELAITSVHVFFVSLSNVCWRVKQALHRFMFLEAVTMTLFWSCAVQRQTNVSEGHVSSTCKVWRESQTRNPEKQAASWVLLLLTSFANPPWHTELSPNCTLLQPWKLYSSSSRYLKRLNQNRDDFKS